MTVNLNALKKRILSVENNILNIKHELDNTQRQYNLSLLFFEKTN